MFLYTDLICAIYRPKKEPAKKVNKNWNWPFLISHY